MKEQATLNVFSAFFFLTTADSKTIVIPKGLKAENFRT